MSTTTKTPRPTDSDRSVDADLHELVQIMGPVLKALKNGDPPSPGIAKAFDSGALGPRHGSVLIALAFSGPTSVSELAKSLGLSLSTVSLMVGELSREGLVSRTEDDADRRRTIVCVHADHADELDTWTHERMGPLRRGLERMTPKDRAGFMAGWRVLREETGDVAATRAARPDRSDR
jgi:DNA-binding MarR family transcriptional regulator